MSAPSPRCFFDISIGGEAKGRVVFELFSHVVPKTAEKCVTPLCHCPSLGPCAAMYPTSPPLIITTDHSQTDHALTRQLSRFVHRRKGPKPIIQTIPHPPRH
jgi:hypothetical protein